MFLLDLLTLNPVFIRVSLKTGVQLLLKGTSEAASVPRVGGEGELDVKIHPFISGAAKKVFRNVKSEP